MHFTPTFSIASSLTNLSAPFYQVALFSPSMAIGMDCKRHEETFRAVEYAYYPDFDGGFTDVWLKTDQTLHSKIRACSSLYINLYLHESVKNIKNRAPHTQPMFFSLLLFLGIREPPSLPQPDNSSPTTTYLPSHGEPIRTAGAFSRMPARGRMRRRPKPSPSAAQTQRLHELPALFRSASGEMYGLMYALL